MKRLKLLFVLSMATLATLVLASCGGGGGGNTTTDNGNTNTDTKTVSGTILDSDGNPLPQASVIINGTSVGITDDSGNIELSESSIGSGEFEVEVVCDGISLYTAKASVTDSGSSKTFQIKSKANSTTDDTTKVLSLSGLVLENGAETQTVIVGARVILQDANGLIFIKKSGPDGYKFENIPEGNYKLIVLKIGYDLNASDVTITSTAFTQDIYLTANGTDFVGVDTYTVKGTVKDDAGNPIEGVQVDFFLRPDPAKPAPKDDSVNKVPGTEPPKPDDKRWGKDGFDGENSDREQSSYTDVPPADVYRTALTDANGNYEFTDLNALGGEMYANFEGYRPQRESFIFTGDASYTVDFALVKLVYTSVTGVVTDQTNTPIANAIIRFAMVDDKFVPETDGSTTSSTSNKGGPDDDFGPGGEPKPGVLGFLKAATDENGAYSIEKILVGKYYVSVHASKYQGYGEEVTLDTNTATLDFKLTPLGYVSVSGKVLDVNGAPIVGAKVHVGPGLKLEKKDIFKGNSRSSSSTDDSEDTKPIPPVDSNSGKVYDVTDDTGSYTLTEVPVESDKIFISADKRGYTPNGVDLSVISGQTYSDVNITLIVREKEQSMISGTVIDNEGKALANAYVWVTVASTDSTNPSVTISECYTDKNGHYRLRSNQGEVVVNATLDGYEEYHQPFVVDKKDNKLQITLLLVSTTE